MPRLPGSLSCRCMPLLATAVSTRKRAPGSTAISGRGQPGHAPQRRQRPAGPPRAPASAARPHPAARRPPPPGLKRCHARPHRCNQTGCGRLRLPTGQRDRELTVLVGQWQRACNLHRLDMSDVTASPCLQHACHPVHAPGRGKQMACTLSAPCKLFAVAQHAGWKAPGEQRVGRGQVGGPGLRARAGHRLPQAPQRHRDRVRHRSAGRRPRHISYRRAGMLCCTQCCVASPQISHTACHCQVGLAARTLA